VDFVNRWSDKTGIAVACFATGQQLIERSA
jgi:hypothetical protein